MKLKTTIQANSGEVRTTITVRTATGLPTQIDKLTAYETRRKHDAKVDAAYSSLLETFNARQINFVK